MPTLGMKLTRKQRRKPTTALIEALALVWDLLKLKPEKLADVPLLNQLGVWPWFSGSDTNGADQRPALSSLPGGRQGGSGLDPLPKDVETIPFYHESVLLQEIIAYLAPAPDKRILDLTLGGGGHSEALLAAGATVIGLDQDPVAIAHATSRLRCFAAQFSALRGNFRDFPEILSEIQVGKLDGILADLGVSSKQLDDPQKGFSFMHDGPLDLRMNPDAILSAADIINDSPVEELQRILIDYGEEPQARRIACALVKQRSQKAILTTAQLADAVSTVCPRKGHKHPATLTFQALRIAVNDELGALEDLLEAAPAWLKPGGRIAIISFHSLEDRLVKRAFQRYAAKEIDKPNWPMPKKNPEHFFTLLTKKPVDPQADEVQRNPRSRSARLRVAERISDANGKESA